MLVPLDQPEVEVVGFPYRVVRNVPQLVCQRGRRGYTAHKKFVREHLKKLNISEDTRRLLFAIEGIQEHSVKNLIRLGALSKDHISISPLTVPRVQIPFGTDVDEPDPKDLYFGNRSDAYQSGDVVNIPANDSLTRRALVICATAHRRAYWIVRAQPDHGPRWGWRIWPVSHGQVEDGYRDVGAFVRMAEEGIAAK